MTSQRPPFGGMAKKKPMPQGGDFASPPDFGSTAPASSTASSPDGSLDPDQDGDMDSSPTIKPESVNYHDDAQNCGTCQYMGQGGQCAVLKMEVSPEGACNAWEGQGQDTDQDQDDMGGGAPPPAAGGAQGMPGGTNPGYSDYGK